MVFHEVSLRVMEALRARRSGAPTTHGVEDDKNGTFMTREVCSDTCMSVSEPFLTGLSACI